MELYEEMAERGIPATHITDEEWENEYLRLYNVLGLDRGFARVAANDIITMYLVLRSREKDEKNVR